ncbi:MAG: adenine phosphoribosyltransferase [FCB group bacterium]|nr:adenine phosphoribosyltransferase [FCB group bacterium]
MRDLKTVIRSLPDFPKPGIIFRDITTLLADPEALCEAYDAIEKYLRTKKVNKIVAIDSRGFLLGGALADRLNIPLIPVRKKGKLPFTTISEEYALEYGTDSLEIHTDAITSGDSVAVLDDLLATGGTLKATCRLIEKLGGEVAGIAVFIELSFLKGRDRLTGYDIMALVDYDSETV